MAFREQAIGAYQPSAGKMKKKFLVTSGFQNDALIDVMHKAAPHLFHWEFPMPSKQAISTDFNGAILFPYDMYHAKLAEIY